MKRTRILLAILAFAAPVSAALTPGNLRCEYQRDPLNVDAQKARLSWTLSSNERAQRQTAYHVLVSSSPALLAQDRGDLWDSREVQSGETFGIEYAGKPLASHTRVFWKVRVRDRDGKAGDWSPPAEWSMGVLRPEDWKAQWIALPRAPANRPMPRFRKQFNVQGPVRRAVLYVSAGGFYEAHLNGARVGDEVLSPLWTDYRKTVYYLAHDITSQLKLGANVFAAELGNGFFNVPGGRYAKFIGSFGSPVLLLMARIEYMDGSVQTVGTDGSWKVKPGPTTFSCIHGGEDYDARLDEPGWMDAGFDDTAWRSAGFDGAPGGELVAQAVPAVRVMRNFPAVRVTTPAAGVKVYDFGQNLAGWPHIRVRGPAGSFVRMVPAEVLKPDGRIDTTSAVGPGYLGPPISFTYTTKGNGIEEWHPRFTYTGFRYLEVTGDAEVVSMSSDFVHSSTAVAGSFTTSDPLFSRIEELVGFAVRSNFQSVLTDCPHREKLGWLEVAHLMGPSILSRFDAQPFYAKIARDTRDAQTPRGLVPDIAPEYTVFRDGFRDSPEWGSAVVAIPWLMYQWFGDVRVLRDSYPAMVRYAGYLSDLSRDGILNHGLGDWYDVGPGKPGPSKLTPRGVTATAFHFRNLDLLAQIARLLGKEDDSRRFSAEAAQVVERFQARFYDPARGYFASGSQAAQAIPLVFQMVPAAERPRVLERLVADIRAHGNRQTAGDIGYRFLIRALTDAGRSDVLYDINSRTDGPSYGYQIAQGVTSLAEAWDANPAQSQNHAMLGHIQEWFTSGLAGIDQTPDSVGFSEIVIRPNPVGSLSSASAYYDSVRGRIASSWSVDKDVFRLDVTIPANSRARIFVPAADAGQVEESGVPSTRAAGLRLLRMEARAAVFEAGSGSYSFVSRNFRKDPP